MPSAVTIRKWMSNWAPVIYYLGVLLAENGEALLTEDGRFVTL